MGSPELGKTRGSGTSSMSGSGLGIKVALYGHTEAVTCLSSAPGFSLLVSGSRDRTCIIWDLPRMVFVRPLRGHVVPVAAICVNELTVSGRKSENKFNVSSEAKGSIYVLKTVTSETLSSPNWQKKFGWNAIHSGCISLLLSRLPKLPSQCYSNGLGKFDNLGGSKEI